MDAYNKTPILKRENGRRVYGTTLPIAVPKESDDFYIISVYGDRLDNLANEFYEDPSYWRILAAANNLGKGSFVVPAGTQIRIPSNPEEIKRLWDFINQVR